MDDAPMNQVLEATGFADAGHAEASAAVRRGAPLPWRNYVRCAFLSAIILAVGVLAYRPSMLRLSILMSMVSPSRGDSLAWKPEVETDVRPVTVKRAPSPAEWRLTAAHTPGWRASRPGSHDEDHWQGGEFATAPWRRTSYNPWTWHDDHAKGTSVKPDVAQMPNQKPESAFRAKDSDPWAGASSAQSAAPAQPTSAPTTATAPIASIAAATPGDDAPARESRVPSLTPIAPAAPVRMEPPPAVAAPTENRIPAIAPLTPADRLQATALSTDSAPDAPASLQLPSLPGGDTLFGNAAAPAPSVPALAPATATATPVQPVTPDSPAVAESRLAQPDEVQQSAPPTSASLRPPATSTPAAATAVTAVPAFTLPEPVARQEQPAPVVTMPTEVNPVRPAQSQTQPPSLTAAATTDLVNEAIRAAETPTGVPAPRASSSPAPAAPASGPVDWKNREITTTIAGAYLTIYPKLKFIGLCVPGQGYIRKYNQVAVPMDVTLPKLHAADGHTPYGKYYVARHERGAEGAKLVISWPSADDARRSGAGPEMLAEIERAWRSQSLPPQTSTAGGGVALTGDRGSVEATMGGFALEQPHMEEIFTALPDGAWVFIQQ